LSTVLASFDDDDDDDDDGDKSRDVNGFCEKSWVAHSSSVLQRDRRTSDLNSEAHYV